PPQALERRDIEARTMGEFDVSGDWNSDRGAELCLQCRSLDPENERLESGLLFVRHFYARRNDTCLVLPGIELATPEARPHRVAQGELLLDDRHRRKANPISRRASAKQDIDAPEPDVAPVHLETCRVGPHVKPHCPEIPHKQLPEFVGTLR